MNHRELTSAVEQRYRRYLRTRYAFRDPDLRRQFSEQMAQGTLSKGPYVESVGSFPTNTTCEKVIQDILGRQVDPAFLQALQGKLPLYVHQEDAIRRVLVGGKNVVVATGTGSGKTEAFLLPILIDLYREHLEGSLARPGVRALIVYPLNALAFDQRDRLGGISRQLDDLRASFRFTFGQYTGETPENRSDSYRNAQDKLREPYPREMVLREDMRERPPHILLTNFSMLEYLLIRPLDSPLFDGEWARTWKFLVLDEAHQYNGALGNEIGMLTRRLRSRLIQSGHTGRLTCIATSATVSSQEEHRPCVARFAEGLFGQPFRSEDVIQGRPGKTDWSGTIEIPVAQLQELQDALAGGDDARISLLCGAIGRGVAGTDCTTDQQLGALLLKDSRVCRVLNALSERAKQMSDLAMLAFPGYETEEQHALLEALLNLLSSAKSPSTGASLVSLRYHHFLRTLEGAFLSYSAPEERWVLTLDRKASDPHQAIYELARCTDCGQHYLVGRIAGGRLEEAIRDSGDPDYGADYFLPLIPGTQIPKLGEAVDAYLLDGETGCVIRSDGEFDADTTRSALYLLRAETSDADDTRAVRCPACGYSATDPIRPIRPGKDGPHVVIASTLHEHLPVDRRRVLAFADSRQDAARFAWYLEDSYSSVVARSEVLRASRLLAEPETDPPTLEDIAHALIELREREGRDEARGHREIERDAWIQLYREFVSRERRLSLFGTGLVSWEVKLPSTLKVPGCLLDPPWNLDESAALDLIRILLDTLRERGAVEFKNPRAVPVKWPELDIPGGHPSVRLGEATRLRSKEPIESWDTRQGRRAKFLEKVLSSRDYQTASGDGTPLDLAVGVLQRIWEALVDARDGAQGLFVHLKDSRRLDPSWWRCRALTPSDTTFVCNSCGAVQSASVLDLCVRHNCRGSLNACKAEDLPENHYRSLYQADLPSRLCAEEHTAQIAKDTARHYQRRFSEGDINLLSSSTTFELGVDLGELDVVFLRNVPPEVFNYAQRAGRAGRRIGRPGLALTFCNRSPHDLYHFADPEERILAGELTPPVVEMKNEKIVLRHMLAVGISSYFREHPQTFSSVEALLEDMEQPALLTHLYEHLAKAKPTIEAELRDVVPEELHEPLGITSGGWLQEVAGAHSRIAQAQAEIASDYANLIHFERDAQMRRAYGDAQWAKRRSFTLLQEDVLSFLSRKAVIPKYGFPVDVVELDIQTQSRSESQSKVQLQRDLSLAISEFAPGSVVMANKVEWHSTGLKKVAGLEWPKKEFRRCRTHNTFQIWDYGQMPGEEPCCDGCVTGQYIEPQFGFLGEESTGTRGAASSRAFSSRPYFVRLIHDKIIHDDYGAVTLTRAAPGRMVVLCEGFKGRSFYICEVCGLASATRKKGHETPWGRPCTGQLKPFALGHEFTTDVVIASFQEPCPASVTDYHGLALSLAYALVEGAARALSVPSMNVDTTVRSSAADARPSIVLYDSVPGGAGLVGQLGQPETLLRCLKEARDRVDGRCGCGDMQSCYGCLRSYRNQFAHRDLVRGPVREYLDAVIAGITS